MIRVAATACVLAAASPAWAAGTATLTATMFSATTLTAAPPGASSCSGCHGAGVADGVPSIQGRPADEIVAALAGFRSGTRPATVMNRIAPGFDEAESRAIAVWLAEQALPR